MAEQTRPSAIVRRPDPETPISEATTAEILMEVIARAKSRRDIWDASTDVPLPAEELNARNRELSLVITLAEDCLTRHNKAVYMERGVFAITDAERIPEMPTAYPVAVVAFSQDEGMRHVGREHLQEPVAIVTRREDVLGKLFRGSVYAPGWDRDLSSSVADEIRDAVEVAVSMGSARP
jgi:hypothetical protein